MSPLKNEPASCLLKSTVLFDALKSQVSLQRIRCHVPFHAGWYGIGRVDSWVHEDADSRKEQRRQEVYTEINDAAEQRIDKEDAPQGPKCQHALAGDLFNDLTANLFDYDLTELSPLDVLGDPHGVLKESQGNIAEYFGARESYYLVNGASSGIIAALLASGIHEGSHVLVARNCHRSVVHGLVLTGAYPHWILPDLLNEWAIWGAIDPDTLDKTLSESEEIELFIMTHPTYEGVESDIGTIATICRKHGVKLIVDEAHGSLWPLFDFLPDSALHSCAQGAIKQSVFYSDADAVIHSLHKSGGSLTQTAILHLPEGSLLHPEDVQNSLNLIQTTSPSYILLANLEITSAFMASPQGRDFILKKHGKARELKAWINCSLRTIRYLPSRSSEKTGFQLFLKSDKMSGESFGTLLEDKYGISYEAVTSHGVLLLLNPGLPDNATEIIASALSSLERQTLDLPDITVYSPLSFSLPTTALSPREAFYAKGERIPRENSAGKISKQLLSTSPPGIPILAPGEIIEPHHLSLLPETLTVVI